MLAGFASGVAVEYLPMHPVSSTSLDLAHKLLTIEDAEVKKHSTASAVGAGPNRVDHTVQVCGKLQGVLTTFAGDSGFRSLLARALTLAKVQDALLAGVSIGVDGSLAGFETLPAPSITAKKKKNADGSGGVLLVAQLLDLLVVFIGEPLTLQLVSSAWPHASFGEARTNQ